MPARPADSKLLKDLKGSGTYDAAMISKDDKGKVHVKKHETAARHGYWGGIAVGSVVGILFPPSVLVTATVGEGAGALVGHMRTGISKKDVKQLGDIIEQGQAALLVVGERTLEQVVATAGLKPDKQLTKEIEVSSKDIAEAIQEAGAEVS